MSKHKLFILGVLILVLLFVSLSPVPGKAASVVSAPSITHIATSPDLPDVIVFSQKDGSGQSWLYYTLDGGKHWHPARTMPVNDAISKYGEFGLAIAPRGDTQYPVRFLIVNGSLLNRSGDFGATWLEQEFPFTSSHHNIAVSPVDGQRLYMGGTTLTPDAQPVCDLIPCSDPIYGFVYTSRDAGVNWMKATEGFAWAMFDPLVVSPNKAFEFYAANSPVDASDYWYRQSDGAWKRWLGVRELVLDAVDSGNLYGASYWITGTLTSTQVLTQGQTSTDGGLTWKHWASMPPGNCTQLLAHPTDSGKLYLLCDGGLYRSINIGKTWELRASAPSSPATDLLVPDYGNPGRILWARSDGLWGSKDTDTSWRQLAAVQPPLQRIFLPVTIRSSGIK